MEDIARECGVTKMTVSRVLAGRVGVRETTRRRVLHAAQRLNYEVNALAKNLSANRAGFIGVAVPFEGFLGSDYFQAVIRGGSPGVLEAGMHLVLFDTNAEASSDGRKLAALYRQRRVDGLLVIARHADDDLYDTLEHARVPMVMVGERSPHAGLSAVTCDDHQGIRLLCAHLSELGHRRIAFVGAEAERSTASSRREAYDGFCRAQGLDLPAWYVDRGDYSVHSGRRAGLRLLGGSPRPTAVVAANDWMALGVIESARELGLRVPQDVSVVGFDDLGIASACYPALTTVHQPVAEMGRLAVEILLAAVADRTVPTRQQMLEVALVARDSTAPPAFESR